MTAANILLQTNFSLLISSQHTIYVSRYMKGWSKMYSDYSSYPYSYYNNTPVYNPYCYHCPHWANPPAYNPDYWKPPMHLEDYGPNPYTVNIKEAALQNDTFRTALWTGKHLQLTLMSINPGEEIGLEMHPHTDQFIRIEQGHGLVMMGDCKENLNYRRMVHENWAIFIPAGKWHNLINTGCIPIKLYSVYAPPEHPHGTVHETKQDAENHHK